MKAQVVGWSLYEGGKPRLDSWLQVTALSLTGIWRGDEPADGMTEDLE